MKKIVIIITILIVVSIISIIFWQWQQINNFLQDNLGQTKTWETHRNEKRGFIIEYPSSWVLIEASNENFEEFGEVVRFQIPNAEELIRAKKIHPIDVDNLVISYWPDMNNMSARGGDWVGIWEHKDLEDFFTDPNSHKQKIGEIMVDNHKAHEVIMGGYGSNYGIMIEEEGIYQLSFNNKWDKEDLGEVEKAVIASFEFIK